MGGRGSGGGRSGGGGRSASSSNDLLDKNIINNYGIDNRSFIGDIQAKLKNMTDAQIDNQYKETKKMAQKAKTEYNRERKRMEKIGKEFDKTQEGTAPYYKKMKEMEQQIKNVQIAQQNANMRHHAHYLVVNEKFNVRGKKK